MNAEFGLHDPFWLLALLTLPVLVWLRRWRATRVLLVPFSAQWHRPVRHWFWWPWIAVLTGVGLLIVGLARPQRSRSEVLPPTQGCDIMLAIDVSGSMASEDFENNGRRINRLEAITPIVEAFMTKRPYDRIGMVVFSGRAYTMAPPTFNHQWLAKQMERLRVGMIEDGTAIGDAVMVGLRRLELSSRSAEGKRAAAFIVLLTDGANNSGVFDPLEAAKTAGQRGIPIYTIATGSHGMVRLPIVNARGQKVIQTGPSEIDEVTLWKMAQQSGGRFFRAEWPDTVDAAFSAVDRGQKFEFERRTIVVHDELFPWLAIPGLALSVLGAMAVRVPWHRWVSA